MGDRDLSVETREFDWLAGMTPCNNTPGRTRTDLKSTSILRFLEPPVTVSTYPTKAHLEGTPVDTTRPEHTVQAH